MILQFSMKMNTKRFNCVVYTGLFLIFTLNLKAERVRLFTPDGGLSNSHISQIFQDSKGFIWIATDNGLNKFNGYDFEVYLPVPNDSASIQSNLIVSVFEDSRGLFWIATAAGLLQYDRTRNIFLQWQLGEFNGRYSRFVFEDSNKNLWISYPGNGIVRLDANTFSPVAFRQNSVISSDVIVCMFEDRYGNLWFGTEDRGIFVLDPQNNTSKNYTTSSSGLSNNRISTISQSAAGSILVGTLGGGINEFDEHTQSFRVIMKTTNFEENLIQSVLIDNNKTAWMATDGAGIFQYDIHGNRTHYWEEAASVCDLRKVKVHHLFQDMQGNIWAALFQKGVLLISASSGSFQNIKNNPLDASKSIGEHCVISIIEDHKGNIWVGTDGDGAYRVHPSGKIDSFTTENTPGFKENVITAVFEDREHNIWFGTYLNGFFRYNTQTGKFDSNYRRTGSEHGLYNNHVSSFAQDDEGNIWIAVDGGGVSVFNTKTHLFKHYYYYADNTKDQISSNWVFDIVIDRDKNIWAGTTNGFNRLNKEKDIFELFINDNNQTISSPIYTLKEDAQGNIWGGYNGLHRIERNTGKITTITTADGLPDNMITGIEEDNNNILWISTGKGLSRYNTETGEFLNFFIEDGIQSNEFRRRSHFKGKNDKMYFGGINGITTFYPSQVLREKPLMNLVFTDFLVNNKSVKSDQLDILKNPMEETTTIRLNYNQNNFTFLFAALEFVMPQRVNYYILMENFDKQWHQISNSNRRVTYTNLNTGSYVFKVQATIDGINVLQKDMRVIILPPWWLSIPAKVAYGILVILLLYGIYVYLSYRQMKQYRESERRRMELEQLVEYRTKELVIAKEKAEESEKYKLAFLANMSHEMRTPLSGIVGLLHFINEDTSTTDRQEYIDLIDNSATQLLRLIDDIMDIAKIEAKQLIFAPVPVNINDLMRELKMFFNNHLHVNKKEQVELILDDSEFMKQCVINVDPVRLRQTLNNLLSNASKFTDNGYIRFGYQPINSNAQLYFFVEDTGIGIKESAQKYVFERFKQVHDRKKQTEYGGTGLGLTICKNIVEMMGGEIGVKSEEGTGTTFYFTLPI